MQRYDIPAARVIRNGESLPNILQRGFSFVQTDAEFVEYGCGKPRGPAFWDKFEIGFYKNERLLNTIRVFADKLHPARGAE